MKYSLLGLLLVFGFHCQAQSLDNAIQSLNDGEILNAKNELMELSFQYPQDADAKFWLGVSLFREYTDLQLNPEREIKPLIDAGISFEKAFFLNPSFSQSKEMYQIKAFQSIAFNTGISNFQKTNLEMAFTLFKMSSLCAKWQKVKDNESFYYAGHCANKLEQFQSALPYLETLVEVDPKNEKYSKELLASYMGLNMTDKASNLLNQVLANNRTSAYFWNEFMILNMKSENYSEALKGAKQLCLLDNTNSDNKTVLASLHDQVGETEESIRLYKEVISSNPRNVQATFNLGVMLYNKAIEIQKSSLSKEKKEMAMRFLLQAEEYILKAESLDPNNPDIPILLENISAMK